MKRFYIASDYELMVDILKAEINFLKSSWQNLLGRPLVVLSLNQMYLGIFCFTPELDLCLRPLPFRLFCIIMTL